MWDAFLVLTLSGETRQAPLRSAIALLDEERELTLDTGSHE